MPFPRFPSRRFQRRLWITFRTAALGALGACAVPPAPPAATASPQVDLIDVARFGSSFGSPFRIDFAPQEGGRFLGRGWGKVEESSGAATAAWAISRQARLRLMALDSSDQELIMRCAAAPSREAAPQSVSLRLNGAPLGALILPATWETHRIAVAQGRLRSGLNILDLEFTRLSAGGEGGAGRALAAQFDWVELRRLQDDRSEPPQSAVAVSPAAVIQSGPSQLDLFSTIPAAARLAGQVSGARHSRVRIRIQPERGAPALLAESDRLPWPIEADLSAWEGQRVQLSFQVLDRGEVRWSKLQIQGSRTEPARAQAAPELPRLSSEQSVILVVFDAANASHFGCYGYPRATTPAVDRFASEPEAVLFERAYANAPYTLASTGSLFTGLYPERHGVIEREFRLDPAAETLAERLRGRGFSSAGFSMNAFASGKFGYQQGFQSFAKQRRLLAGLLAWLDRKPKPPLFLYVHFMDPHAPHRAKPRFRQRFVDPAYPGPVSGSMPYLRQMDQGGMPPPADLQQLKNLYDADLAAVDEEFSTLLAALKRYRLYDDALIILTSDHGEAFFEHGQRGHNTTVYEEMVRIPLILKFPKGLRPDRRRIAEPVQSVDLLPSLMALAGAPIDPASVDGLDLNPLIFEGRQTPERFLLSRSRFGPQFAIWDRRFKLIVRPVAPGLELYDLEADPAERRNLVHRNPVRAGYLLQALSQLRGAPPAAFAAPNQVDEETRKELRALGYL
ncbi:MAG TPA: sulfatase [Acidobacteriota bacterium]